MQKFFDNPDKCGVRITCEPVKEKSICKTLIKKIPPAIFVGNKIELEFTFEKLKNFDENFWHGKNIVEKLPGFDARHFSHIDLKNKNIVKMRINTDPLSCEGVAEYRISTTYLQAEKSFNDVDAFSIYSTSVRDKGWLFWNWLLGLTGAIIGGLILHYWDNIFQ